MTEYDTLDETEQGIVDAIQALLYETHATRTQYDLLLAAFTTPRIESTLVDLASERFDGEIEQRQQYDQTWRCIAHVHPENQTGRDEIRCKHAISGTSDRFCAWHEDSHEYGTILDE